MGGKMTGRRERDGLKQETRRSSREGRDYRLGGRETKDSKHRLVRQSGYCISLWGQPRNQSILATVPLVRRGIHIGVTIGRIHGRREREGIPMIDDLLRR